MTKGLFAWIAVVVCILILLAMIFKASRDASSPPASSEPVSSSSQTQAPAAGDVSYMHADASMISLTSPKVGAIVPSQFALMGQARGNWYFEASFPVEVRAVGGSVIATALAQAEDDWMTTELVPFTAVVNTGAYKGPAIIILKKDNPSGLPENDASVSIPVVIQ